MTPFPVVTRVLTQVESPMLLLSQLRDVSHATLPLCTEESMCAALILVLLLFEGWHVCIHAH